MPPKFGTSGLRGLVRDLTAPLATRYVQAFLSSCSVGTRLFVGHDLRPSSAGLAHIAMKAAQQMGVSVTMCGPVTTPALALAAAERGASAIMVTGSHVPADRNGLKFYTASGEITKAEEARITDALDRSVMSPQLGMVTQDTTVMARYAARYQSAFRGALRGQHIGLYQHSTVGRDALADLLQSLGARVTTLDRSDGFIPIDTEALPAALRKRLRAWAQAGRFDAIVSMDADGDRPLLTDEYGEMIPGDILGQITAQRLHAETVVTPLSSNSGVALSGCFAQVIRTSIGSPFVIAAMQRAGGDVVGYEANGGFILGFDAQGTTGPLAPLMTRDAVLPIIAVLAHSAKAGVAACVASQPKRFTATDRLQDVDLRSVAEFLALIRKDPEQRAAFLDPLKSDCIAMEETDGLRMTLQDARIIHLRASGNAPEMRIYAEAETPHRARQTCSEVLPRLESALARSASCPVL